MSFKVLRMVKRPAAESREDFGKRWLGELALQNCVITLATGEIALGGTDAAFDGMAAHYFPSLADARAAAVILQRFLDRRAYKHLSDDRSEDVCSTSDDPQSAV